MIESATQSFSEHTTLRVGGHIDRFIETESTDELIACIENADRRHERLLVIGEGSNLLISDDGFRGTVVHPVRSQIDIIGPTGPDERHKVLVRCPAGTRWDQLVGFTVAQGLSGIEALSGIPGCIGSACVQNIGAYGQEMGTSLVCASLYDRALHEVVNVHADKLQLGYRRSLLRDSLSAAAFCNDLWYPSPRWIVLDATFGLRDDPLASIDHPQLAAALGVSVGERQPASAIRDEALAVRAAKGMLRDDNPKGPAPDYDRWSSGSFFTNPLLTYRDADALPDDAPRYPAPGGVKTSAAWLIQQAGFTKGFGVHGPQSRATLSTKHTLALTNRGNASAEDILELARYVRDGVHAKFGIVLEPETVIVGAQL